MGFTDHSDVSKPISLSSISLERQYSQLTEKEKLMVGCKLLGMNHIPCDILTFVSDDYYLGSVTNKGKGIFDYWLDKLPEIFPTPIITKYPYLSFTGCIGSGKSYMSKLIGLYHYHRLDCCMDAFTSLGLARSGKIAMAFFHNSSDTAYTDFVRFYKDTVFQLSPYFKKLYNNPPIRLIASGPRSSGSVIGTQLVYTVLSELGFWKPAEAISKTQEVLGRYQNRFFSKRFNFGQVIADSSAHDADQGASDLFEESVPKPELFRVSPSHWECRPKEYIESGDRKFKVYQGDSSRGPSILPDDIDPIKENMDPDRIVEVPIQLKFNFVNDIVRSLNDFAGIPYSSKDLFFSGDLTHLLKASSIIETHPDVIECDFYDKTDTIYSKVCDMIYRIPRGTQIFLHYDIGLKKDVTGIAIAYYDGELRDDSGMSDHSYPIFKIPLLVGLSRKRGQSTSLDHLVQFIAKLKESYPVVFSADTFASAGVFQSCERMGIEYSTISIDRTTDPAFSFKNIVNTDRLTLPYNERFLRECSELKITSNGAKGDHVKVDHPKVSSSYEFDYKNRLKSEALPGSKDLFDAASGAVYSCFLKYSQFLEEGGHGGIHKQLKAMTDLTKDAREEAAQAFQDMLENIF